MKFSQRIGITKVKVNLQIESMDEELRISIWNNLKIIYLDNLEGPFISNTKYKPLFYLIWKDFFKYTLDTLDDYFIHTYEKIRVWFFKCEWYEIYDFIEFVANTENPSKSSSKLFIKLCNESLEKEKSAYRFVNNKIVQITNESEILSIEESLERSESNNLKGVYIHLSEALNKLSDRKSPDYRNSIKESISAVESIAQVISGDSKAELGKSLKIIEEKVGMHSALKKGFCSIYGYTSDEGGIRHAMLEESDIFFEDAKYMLVSCTTFINYLIMKSERAGLKL